MYSFNFSYILKCYKFKNIDISILKSLSLTFVLSECARYLPRKFQLLEAREPLVFAFYFGFHSSSALPLYVLLPSPPKPFLIKTDPKMEADKNSKSLHLLVCHSFPTLPAGSSGPMHKAGLLNKHKPISDLNLAAALTPRGLHRVRK